MPPSPTANDLQIGRARNWLVLVVVKITGRVHVSAVPVDHNVAAKGVLGIFGHRCQLNRMSTCSMLVEINPPRPFDLGEPTCRRRSLELYRDAAMANRLLYIKDGRMGMPRTFLRDLAHCVSELFERRRQLQMP